MNFLVSAGTGLSKIACSAEECLSWIIILLNILTVFYLVFCAWFKITKTVRIVGYVWASALLVGTVAVIAAHTCIFTILSGVFTGLILMAVLSVVFNKSVFANDGEEHTAPVKKPSGSYVIHRTDDNKYVFLLYNGKKTALCRSTYKYDSVDEVKKAVALSRENGLLASVENKTKNWIEFVNLPKFVMYEENGKFRFNMTTSDESVILASGLFDDCELCEKRLKEAVSAVKSEKLYYSEREVIAGWTFLSSGEKPEEKSEPKKEIVAAVVRDDTKKKTAPSAEHGKEKKPVEPEPPVEVEEAKAVISDEPDDDEEETVVIVDEQGHCIRIRYNKSFTAKLKQASDVTKKYYTELKNEVLSYAKTRSRMSWAFDSVNTGKTPLIKFGIRGKTLCVYYALNTDDYADSKYKIEKVKAAKYDTVSCMYRVKNNRRVKYAKQLIAEVCKKSGLAQGKIPTVDYSVPYETTEDLIKKGLIKEVRIGK